MTPVQTLNRCECGFRHSMKHVPLSELEKNLNHKIEVGGRLR